MIDISQLAGNAAAALNSLKSPDAGGKGADANLFKDTLTRARQDGQPAAQQAKVPARDSKPDAGQNTQKPQPEQAGTNNALPKQDDAKVAKKDGAADTADAADPETADKDDTATASADAAAVAAALAAAALLAPLPNPQQAQPTGAGADGTALTGLPGLPGQPAATAPATAANAAPAAAPDAAALQAQVDANVPAGIVTEAPKGSVPNAGDTLALIAQQRAALQNASPTTADKLAAAATTAAPAQGAPQHAGGQGAGQQQGNLGQSNQPAPTIADNTQAAPSTQPSATPFAAAQAAARTGEAADTGATNSSSAATLASALAAAQAPNHAGHASAAAAAARPVIAPNVGDSQWSQALGQQMVRLSTQGNQTAELDLNPPNLGPLKVVLNVVNDQAQAQFVSPHQAVRAAVEAALPQLRTSMAEAGIQLGQTSVGADGFAQANSGGQQQQPQRQASGSSFGQTTGFGNEPATPVAATPRTPRPLARGEVDTFA
ncbi:flagellar hook-length control protein FliK [Cupriavidus sp. H18C2]|uniref:flagellar hook-length control protein FliK n=1 Tax=Cupriavidus sp. H18C2 TaxID=3241602 RepID=UPI003BF7A319